MTAYLRCPYCGHPVSVCAREEEDRGLAVWAECGNCCAEWDHAGTPTGEPLIKTIAQRLAP